MRLTYNIPSPLDKKGGYLSASSKSYPFLLDGKRWLTVEHYMLAKRFEGSTLEEKIRTAETVYIAKHLANPRYSIETEGDEGTLKRMVKYDRDRSVDIRSDWKSQDGLSLYRATVAKFEQNPKIKKMFLSTEGIDLVGIVGDYDYGKILCHIRDEFLSPCKKVRVSLTMPRPFEDIPGDKNLNSYETKVLGRVCKYMKKIGTESDGLGEVSVIEMTEDALYNVLRTEDALEILKASRKWVESLTWTDVVDRYPKFECMIRLLKDIVPTTPSNKIKVSMIVASIFRWGRMVAPVRIFQKEKNEKIYLPPIRRSYRVRPPNRLLVKGSSKNERGALYISLFANYDRSTYSKLVEHFENMSRVERPIALEKFSKCTPEERKVFVEELTI